MKIDELVKKVFEAKDFLKKIYAISPLAIDDNGELDKVINTKDEELKRFFSYLRNTIIDQGARAWYFDFLSNFRNLDKTELSDFKKVLFAYISEKTNYDDEKLSFLKNFSNGLSHSMSKKNEEGSYLKLNVQQSIMNKLLDENSIDLQQAEMGCSTGSEYEVEEFSLEEEYRSLGKFLTDRQKLLDFFEKNIDGILKAEMEYLNSLQNSFKDSLKRIIFEAEAECEKHNLNVATKRAKY